MPSRFLDSKGQEAGPFELLVAVIMMGFVLVVGYQAIQAVNEQNCTQNIEKALNGFKSSLETVASSNQNEELNLDIKPCWPEKDQTLTLNFEQDPQKCSNYCSSARSACIILVYSNPGIFSSHKCINIKTSTVFETSSDRCVYRDGYELYELFKADTIPDGLWFFKNITPASNSDYPVICAFRQCKGSTC